MRGLALALATLAACGGDDGGLTPDAGLIERFQGGWNLTWTCATTCVERPGTASSQTLLVVESSLVFQQAGFVMQTTVDENGCLAVPEAMEGARRRLAFAVCPVGDGLEASIAWTRTDSPTSVDGAWVMRATR